MEPFCNKKIGLINSEYRSKTEYKCKRFISSLRQKTCDNTKSTGIYNNFNDIPHVWNTFFLGHSNSENILS